VGITNNEWFRFLAAKGSAEEINFWRPTPQPYRQDFYPGMPFLFKLHAPEEFIVGGGFFLRFVPVPLSLAWGAFREANGASTLEGFRRLIGKHLTNAPSKDPYIGCNILSEPFYFSRSHWIPSARYMRGPIVAGKGNFEEKQAQELWNEVKTILALDETVKTLGPATMNAIDKQRYGQPVLIAPRLGQGSFRTLVTTAYSYRCAITRERTLPVLQAAHIRPYAEGGMHELSNGLLLRSDLHTLFDQHYISVDPNKRTLIVSRRIREQFENGRDYYALHDRSLSPPADALAYHPQTTWLFISRDFRSLRLRMTPTVNRGIYHSSGIWNRVNTSQAFSICPAPRSKCGDSGASNLNFGQGIWSIHTGARDPSKRSRLGWRLRLSVRLQRLCQFR
jgi:putative restriction endonuclease